MLRSETVQHCVFGTKKLLTKGTMQKVTYW